MTTRTYHGLHAARPPLGPGERRLATDTGVIVTTHSVYCDGDGGWTRLGWEEVGHVTPAAGQIRLTRLPPDGTPIYLPARWEHLVRERVNATVLASARVRLGPVAGALVIARRRPGSNEPHWVVLLDRWVDPAEPDLEDLIAAAIHRVRTDLGI